MTVLPARVVGHGPTGLIAVHGWLGDHRLFEPFFEHIDTARLTYAFLDCRGYADRRGEPGPFTIEAMAADIQGLADHLGWDTFHAVGHSMGAMAAQRLMVDAPDRLRSAILIAGVPASGARIDERRRALLLRAIAEPQARRELIDVNTGRARDGSWVDALLDVSLSSTRRQALEGYMAAWTETDFAAEAAGSEVPVLAICGSLDPGCTVSLMEETILAWYARASLAVIDGAGHYPMREEPAALASLIDRFVTHSVTIGSKTNRRGG